MQRISEDPEVIQGLFLSWFLNLMDVIDGDLASVKIPKRFTGV